MKVVSPLTVSHKRLIGFHIVICQANATVCGTSGFDMVHLMNADLTVATKLPSTFALNLCPPEGTATLCNHSDSGCLVTLEQNV